MKKGTGKRKHNVLKWSQKYELCKWVAENKEGLHKQKKFHEMADAASAPVEDGGLGFTVAISTMTDACKLEGVESSFGTKGTGKVSRIKTLEGRVEKLEEDILVQQIEMESVIQRLVALEARL